MGGASSSAGRSACRQGDDEEAARADSRGSRLSLLMISLAVVL